MTKNPFHALIRRGEALFSRGQYEAAFELFIAVVEKEPDNVQALNDAGLAASELGDQRKAITYFRQALESDPSAENAFFNLLDVLADDADPTIVRDSFSRHAEAIPDSEEKELYRKALFADGPGVQVQRDPVEILSDHGGEGSAPDALNIAFVCGPNTTFITDIEQDIAEKHNVKACHLESGEELQVLQDLVDWADVTWFEWCDAVLARASHVLTKNSAVICRVHSYEAFTTLPENVKWSFVDHLVFVAPHIRDIFIERFKPETRRSVVGNGVAVDKLAYRKREPGFQLAYVGYINFKKNPELLLQCMFELVQRDARYVLHIAGEFQEPRYKLYFDQMIPALGLSDHVVFHGWVDDIDSWLEDKSYIVSTSLLESFGMGIAEGMAKGLKPVIHNFVGANHIYRDEWLFDSVSEFVDHVIDRSYDSHVYRQYIENKYALRDQLSRIDQLLTSFGKKSESPYSRRYWEARYAQGGHSGAGSYGRLAKFKADVINAFVETHDVSSVMEFGCGDGNQLSLSDYPEYLGLDVSSTAVERCRARFESDESMRFQIYDPSKFQPRRHSADLCLSLDVVYHLVEDDVFESHMEHLFACSDRYVIIYSNNTSEQHPELAPHLRYRKFTAWIDEHEPGWRLLEKIPNKYVSGEGTVNASDASISDFYIFEKTDAVNGNSNPRTESSEWRRSGITSPRSSGGSGIRSQCIPMSSWWMNHTMSSGNCAIILDL